MKIVSKHIVICKIKSKQLKLGCGLRVYVASCVYPLAMLCVCVSISDVVLIFYKKSERAGENDIFSDLIKCVVV